MTLVQRSNAFMSLLISKVSPDSKLESILETQWKCVLLVLQSHSRLQNRYVAIRAWTSVLSLVETLITFIFSSFLSVLFLQTPRIIFWSVWILICFQHYFLDDLICLGLPHRPPFISQPHLPITHLLSVKPSVTLQYQLRYHALLGKISLYSAFICIPPNKSNFSSSEIGVQNSMLTPLGKQHKRTEY